MKSDCTFPRTRAHEHATTSAAAWEAKIRGVTKVAADAVSRLGSADDLGVVLNIIGQIGIAADLIEGWNTWLLTLVLQG